MNPLRDSDTCGTVSVSASGGRLAGTLATRTEAATKQRKTMYLCYGFLFHPSTHNEPQPPKAQVLDWGLSPSNCLGMHLNLWQHCPALLVLVLF